ncbi:hypothetical protein TRFO_20232 [Tritrichomonas foetus]|uniref:Uncharacterized protein n=1 Tax=Tritrichomonas foetus TaxID=1144522 RepID=A0A1J4KGE5_9EUKA|nr:hypothetical protein TRFO_20232 [Tritrichomonas foetus]|eukprot:OHT10479.1 hypothetical protein TRFO_20232 [Tritrichomonas foetus]
MENVYYRTISQPTAFASHESDGIAIGVNNDSHISHFVKHLKGKIRTNNKPNTDSKINTIQFRESSPGKNTAICHNKLDWRNYASKNVLFIDPSSMEDSFQGILNYIHICSETKFNVEEIAFDYTETKSNQTSDPTAIFSYNDKTRKFQTGTSKYPYFSIRFKRIRVRPVAYAIRSNVISDGSPHLQTFVFQGFDVDKQKWVLLDERVNSNDLIPDGHFALYNLYSEKYFQDFRILQTGRAHNSMMAFALAGFEIHGDVQLIDEESEVSGHDIHFAEIDSLEFNPYSFGNEDEWVSS